MVGCVIERGWTIEATAERFQVDAKTVRKWRDRFLAEGEAGLQDRSSRPRRSPNQTPYQLMRSSGGSASSRGQRGEAVGCGSNLEGEDEREGQPGER
jgi:transposase-like protein